MLIAMIFHVGVSNYFLHFIDRLRFFSPAVFDILCQLVNLLFRCPGVDDNFLICQAALSRCRPDVPTETGGRTITSPGVLSIFSIRRACP